MHNPWARCPPEICSYLNELLHLQVELYFVSAEAPLLSSANIGWSGIRRYVGDEHECKWVVRWPQIGTEATSPPSGTDNCRVNMSTNTHRALLPLTRPLVSNVSARLEIQGQLLYSFSAYLSFLCWPCKLVQNILWTNCKLSKYMFKGQQAKSSLSSNLCVKLISQKSKKVKLYQVPRQEFLRGGEVDSAQNYFYSGGKY